VLAPGEDVALVPVWVSRDFKVNYLATNSNPIADLDVGALGTPSFSLLVPASPGVRLTLRVVGVRIGNISDARVCQDLAVLVGADPQAAPPSAPAGVWEFQFEARQTLSASERFGIPLGTNSTSSTITRSSPSNQELDFQLSVTEVGDALAPAGDVIAFDPASLASDPGIPASLLDPQSWLGDPTVAETWGSVTSIRAAFGLG
jgi:hypothetical protein